MAQKNNLVGVFADCDRLGGSLVHFSGRKYLKGLMEATDLMPVVIPAFGEKMSSVLDHIGGVMLTGSLSNVHPGRYGQEETELHKPFDHDRDDTILPLVGEILERGIPLIAICRGFQEFNVALGGSLHPALHTMAGKLDHRMPDSTDREVCNAPQHAVNFTPGGLFESWVGCSEYRVNSLHHQGVDQLAPSLTVEAVSEDGVIEGFRLADAPGFNAAVQWHPEYKPNDNIFARAFYRAFEKAVNKQ
jgi:putative glutamine amidotransferase